MGTTKKKKATVSQKPQIYLVGCPPAPTTGAKPKKKAAKKAPNK